MAGFWAKILEFYGLAWWKVKPLGRKRKKKVFKRRRQQWCWGSGCPKAFLYQLSLYKPA